MVASSWVTIAWAVATPEDVVLAAELLADAELLLGALLELELLLMNRRRAALRR